MNIIDTKNIYTYSKLIKDIKMLKEIYPFLSIKSIGKSVLDKSIKVIKIGEGKKEIFYSATYHANEWITSLVLMKFVEEVCKAYTENKDIYKYNIKTLIKDITLYVVPMVNPDGVDLVNGKLENSEVLRQIKKISNEYSNITYPNGWKANIKGVDLNLQFPAGWEEAKKIKFSKGYNKPAPRDFVGPKPLSEPEAQAIYNFTKQHKFDLILAYHSAGETIYWKYKEYLPKNSEKIAKEFSIVSNYTYEETPYESSFAGYKDWYIQEYNKPGYTIEVGNGTSPLPLSDFNKIYEDNKKILTLGLKLA